MRAFKLRLSRAEVQRLLESKRCVINRTESCREIFEPLKVYVIDSIAFKASRRHVVVTVAHVQRWTSNGRQQIELTLMPHDKAAQYSAWD